MVETFVSTFLQLSYVHEGITDGKDVLWKN